MKDDELNEKEEVKKEVKETFEEVKKQMKDVNFKEETQKSRGLVEGLIKSPMSTLKKVYNDTTKSYFKTAILLLAVWVALEAGYYVLNYYEYLFRFKNLILSILIPILQTMILFTTIYMLNKNKTTFIQVFSTVILAKIPKIISALLVFLNLINYRATYIIYPVRSALSTFSTVFLFFVVRNATEEKDSEKIFKNYAVVIGVYALVRFVLQFLGIDI